MAIQLATTDSLSRVPAAAGAVAASPSGDVAAGSPFDLLLIASAEVGPAEITRSVIEMKEAETEELDQDMSNSPAHAIVAPVVILPMLPPDAATLDAPLLNYAEELPQVLVVSIATEPVAASLTFVADGNMAEESTTNYAISVLPPQAPAEEGATHEPAHASHQTKYPATVAIFADGLAQPAKSHMAAEFHIDQSGDAEQIEDRDRLSEQLSLPADDTTSNGVPPVAKAPLEPPPPTAPPPAPPLPLIGALALQPSIVAAAPPGEIQSAATSQPASGDSRPIDAARLLQRVVRAFAAAKDGGEVRLRLSPPELGALVLDVRVQDGALVARLEAETTSVRTVLVENLPALRDRLAEQGIRIERFDVDLRQPGGGGPDWSAHQPFQESNSRQQSMRERRPLQVAEGVVARTRAASQDALSHDLRRLNVIV
jgi:hypothetical protein